MLAWRKLERAFNHGDVWFDELVISAFRMNLVRNLETISRQLVEGTYKMNPIQPIPFPKGGIEKDKFKVRQSFFIDFRDQLGQQDVAPRPRELRQDGVDDHRLAQGKRDLCEHLQIGRAVQARSLEDRARDGVKIALLHHIADRGGRGVEEDQRLEPVDEAELRHDDVDRGQTHEAGEHTQHQRELFQPVTPVEAEARHDIARQQDQNRAEDAASRGDIEGVEEPRLVRIQAVDVVREQVDEGLQAERLREEALEIVQAARLGERREDQPQAREQEDRSHDEQQEIGADVVRNTAGCEFLFH